MTDIQMLRDLYGSQGHIFADLEAQPRFLEEPGQLDLVYKIAEGEPFRVGQINVHIAGEFPHTRRNVVLNRLSLRPGDLIDIREIRNSERRLTASQLFETRANRRRAAARSWSARPNCETRRLPAMAAADCAARAPITSHCPRLRTTWMCICRRWR